MNLKYIQQALNAAKYHEDQAFKFAHPLNSDYDKVVAHLRAYFWELWSVWDYILQQANSETIKLDPESVKGKIIEQIKEKFPEYKYLGELEKFQDDDRLKKISFVRNYAHKWQIMPNLVEINGDTVNVITLIWLKNYNTIPNQINIDRNDLWFMDKMVNQLIQNNFFGDIKF